MNPAHILTPGITIKLAGGRVYGHLTVLGIEVDPTGVGAPGVARQVAAAVVVDPVVTGGVVVIAVRAPAGVRAQPYPADILGPDVAFQMVIIDRDPAAVAGVKVEPAGVTGPGPFVGTVDVARRINYAD